MREIKQKHYDEERALFKSQDLNIEDSIFENGESPLKESQNIHLKNSVFRWKYPLWYCKNISVEQSYLLETARSGIWYTHHIDMSDSTIEAPKTFRKASYINLNNIHMPTALETFWNCKYIDLNNVSARGDYFAYNSSNIKIKNLSLTGNYCFDSCKNIEIHDSTLISKDAFWNCENVVVYNSIIVGEYLAWNSKNITFVNCTIESLQGLCYIDHLKMVNCKLLNTILAFEYCQNIDVQINSHIDSIKNPISGMINALSIGEIIDDEMNRDNIIVNVLEG